MFLILFFLTLICIASLLILSVDILTPMQTYADLSKTGVEKGL